MKIVCSIPLNSETVIIWINKNLYCYSVISISDAKLKQMGEARFGMEKQLAKDSHVYVNTWILASSCFLCLRYIQLNSRLFV